MYTTKLLTQTLTDMPPRHRVAAGVSTAVLVCCAIGANLITHRTTIEPLAARIPSPIVVLATGAPPTPTPEPQPRLVELASGAILGYDPSRGWYVVRDAPVNALSAPTAAPEVQTDAILASAPIVAPEPVQELTEAPADAPETLSSVPLVAADPCAAWHAPLALPAGCE